MDEREEFFKIYTNLPMEESQAIEDMKREIALERLRQAPSTVNISFGSDGKFMNRDELIDQVEKNTELGKRIIRIQIEYLRAFKKGILSK